MLVARTGNGMFILGLDAENVRRLVAGEHIFKSLPQFGGTDDVLIMYGDTLDDIRAELERHVGPLPAPSKPRLDG